MQIKGEYICANGLVTPNNVTLAGAAYILAAAMRGDSSANLEIGLCEAVPTPTLTIADVVEPAAGGYARQGIASTALGWPTVGAVNNERYIESDWIIFSAGAYGVAVNRLFLTEVGATDDDPIYSISSAFPAPLTITSGTLEADRKFKFRLYLR